MFFKVFIVERICLNVRFALIVAFICVGLALPHQYLLRVSVVGLLVLLILLWVFCLVDRLLEILPHLELDNLISSSTMATEEW